MSGNRDPERKLLDDAMRFKRERDAARAELVRRDALLVELRAELIALYLQGRLRRLEYFHRFIQMENVVGADGRIDRAELEARVTDLVRRMPELAAPAADVGRVA